MLVCFSKPAFANLNIFKMSARKWHKPTTIRACAVATLIAVVIGLVVRLTLTSNTYNDSASKTNRTSSDLINDTCFNYSSPFDRSNIMLEKIDGMHVY